MDRTTADALRAFEHAESNDGTVEDALDQLRDAAAEAEWDFEAMPDVDVGSENP